MNDDEIQKRELLQKYTFWRVQVEIDYLTKLYTRAALDEKLSSIHKYSLQNQGKPSILLTDHETQDVMELSELADRRL